MRHRLTHAILLLYPRRVRDRHGPEMVALIDDLIEHDKRSCSRLFIRLAGDGLMQRMASTATAWTAVAVLAATTIGGLAASDFASASAIQTMRQAAQANPSAPVASSPPCKPIPPVVPRASGEVVPHSARVLNLSWSQPGRRSLVVLNATKVHQIAQLVNALPVEGTESLLTGHQRTRINFTFSKTRGG